jgi:NADPH2:quinone reductase
VRVVAAAVNFFDLLRLTGRYQTKTKRWPSGIGAECSGIVIESRAAAPHLQRGRAVFLGMTTEGSQASEIVVPGRACFPKPLHWSHAEAASFAVGYMTAFHGLKQRGNLKRGDVCLVTGAGGGMGSIAVSVAKRLGATVIAAASSAAKLDVARRCGADHLIQYSSSSSSDEKKIDLKKAVLACTGGKRLVDVCYDVVGGSTFKQCIRCMAGRGRLLVIGFASGKIPSIPANLVLVKGFSVVGVRAGAELAQSPAMQRELVQCMLSWTTTDSNSNSNKSHTTAAPPLHRPVVQRFPLSRFRDAFRVLLERRVLGKACIMWQQQEAVTAAALSKL